MKTSHTVRYQLCSREIHNIPNGPCQVKKPWRPWTAPSLDGPEDGTIRAGYVIEYDTGVPGNPNFTSAAGLAREGVQLGAYINLEGRTSHATAYRHIRLLAPAHLL